jgi:spermidine/putrescine transport system permease protein
MSNVTRLMQTYRQHLLHFLRHHPHSTVVLLLSPAAVCLLVFTLMPVGIVVYYSFLSRGPWGTILPEVTLENYRQLLDPVFLTVCLRSLRLALLTTGLCLLMGYVLAYWIAVYGGPYKQLFLFLVILPFWTSDLVRVYAWMTLLADHGVINNVLLALGARHEPIPLLHNEVAVLIGLVYTYLPFMILPLYAALERLDRAVLEAAADLGATPARRLYKVTLPLTRGGMLSGSVLVFVPSLGEFLIPELLGGAKAMMLGKFIALKITGLRHWPLGAAFALLLLTIVLLLLFVYLRLGGGKEAFQEQGL